MIEEDPQFDVIRDVEFVLKKSKEELGADLDPQERLFLTKIDNLGDLILESNILGLRNDWDGDSVLFEWKALIAGNNIPVDVIYEYLYLLGQHNLSIATNASAGQLPYLDDLASVGRIWTTYSVNIEGESFKSIEPPVYRGGVRLNFSVRMTEKDHRFANLILDDILDVLQDEAYERHIRSQNVSE